MITRRSTLMGAGGLAGISALGLLGCERRNGQGQTATNALRPVRVRLDWTPWTPHAALFVAREKGYFQAAGLSTNLYAPPDPEATLKLVAAGHDDFGVSYMTDVLLARAQGVKVVSIAALVPQPLNCILTLKASGIVQPSGLEGKTVGTTGVPSDQAYMGWVLKHGGVDPKSVRMVNIGFDLAEALKARKVDAIIGGYWPWEGQKLGMEGAPVNIIRLQDFGVPSYYELVLVTREDMLRAQPEVVRSFLKATIRGQKEVQANPAEAIDILHRANPDASATLISKSLSLLLPIMDGDGTTFRQDPKVWAQMADFMKANGLLTTTPDVPQVMTNDFLGVT